MVRILSHEHMKMLLEMHEVIEAVEEGFRACASHPYNTPVRLPLDVPEHNAVVLYMPAHLSEPPTMGAKVVSVYPGNPSRNLPVIMGTYLLHEADTGKLLAIMDATYMTGIRTAAASAVATKYLARDDTRTLGIIGAGVQAGFHIEALCCVRTFERILVYNRTSQKGASFVERMRTACPVPVEQTQDPGEIAREADVIATCTAATEPVMDGGVLAEGVHINAVGAFTPEMRELDDHTMQNARIVVDTYEGALAEAGDILIPMKHGTLARDDLFAELGEIVAGKKPGRAANEENTVFKSVGFAMEDAVTARLAYERSVALNIGAEVDL